jgi:uncharacterized membrane protein
MSPPPPSPKRTSRLGYVDWMRGLAVLLMIETHAYSAWLRPAAKEASIYAWIRILGGAPAPLFLFLAGLSLALASARRLERGAVPSEVARTGLRRGLEVLGYAVLFRLWMFTTGGFSDPGSLLKADVLNCIGLSMALAAAAALPWRTPTARVLAALALATATTLLTPLVWNAPAVLALPASLRAYLAGGHPLAAFPVFPWAGFTVFGLAAGLLMTSVRGRAGSRIALLALIGFALVGLGLGLDRLPAVYAHEDFWRTSPSFFWIRCGILLLILAFAWIWERAPLGAWPSPLRQMGRTSLLVYWAHIEVVYGAIFTYWARGRLGLGAATFGWIAVAIAMLLLSRIRTNGLRGVFARA